MKQLALLMISAVCIARDALACCGRSNSTWTVLGWSRDGSKVAFWNEGDDECRFWKSGAIYDTRTGESIGERFARMAGDVAGDQEVRETRARTRAVRRWAAQIAPVKPRRYRPRGLDLGVWLDWESIAVVIDRRSGRAIARGSGYDDVLADPDGMDRGLLASLPSPRMYRSPDGRGVVVLARSDLGRDTFPLFVSAEAFAAAPLDRKWGVARKGAR